MDFELFGEAAPNTVNNFLGMCSGELSKTLWYQGSKIHKVCAQRWIMGGDLFNQDGTGSASVYEKGSLPDFEAESNSLKFSEPYLLAASANDEGRIGSQFFITLSEQRALDETQNVIFGRVVQGVKALHHMAEIDEFRKHKNAIEKMKDEMSDTANVENMFLMRKKRKLVDADSVILIRRSGVYK